MNVRLATQDDMQELCGLYTEFFAYNAAQQPKSYVAAREEGAYPGAVLASQSGSLFVAEINKKIVGFVHVEEEATPPYPSVRPCRFACIVDFMVGPQHRRSGAGRLLLEEVKNWAKSRGLAYVELMVLENNDIGRSFYEKEDFLTVSRTMRLDM